MGEVLQPPKAAEAEMTLLLDTSVIIDALGRRRGRREWLRSLVDEGHRLACCGISVAEVYSGMHPDETEITWNIAGSLEYVHISREAARHAGEMRTEWSRKGRTLGLADAIIAAVALDFDLTLATDNRKDFPMPQLRFVELPTA